MKFPILIFTDNKMIATNAYPDILAQSQIDDIAEKCMKIKPLVAIRCITYNHEPYIRDALDGFVMQRTTFPFVAIVHDDASTDNTAAIIREYADKYPDIIKPIYETENQYCKRDGSLRRIMNAACEATGAKYYAMCEGDDYWIAPIKLQKQVDFLESHPDYSMCFHNAIIHHEDKSNSDHLFASLQTREYDISENMDHWIVPTASLVFKKSVYCSPYFKKYLASDKIMVGDYPLIQTCAKEGKIYGFSEVLSVYRLQASGWTQQKNLSSRLALKLIRQELEYRRIFGGYHNKYTPKAIARHSRAAVSLLYKGQIKDAIKVWSLALRYAPWQTIKANTKFIFHTVKTVV